jgi:oxalate decarboxylase/phosphoglucose isomerase-like protein (cupin superfamily)
VLEAGATDHQKPQEDEVYYVASGRANHLFYDITDRLDVLVFFGPKASAQRAALDTV